MAVSGMPSFAFSGATNLVAGQEEVVYEANSFDPILAAGTETDVEPSSIKEVVGSSRDERAITQNGKLTVSMADSTIKSAEAAEKAERYTVLVLDIASPVNWLSYNNQVIYTAEAPEDYTKAAALTFCAQAGKASNIAIVSFDGEARVSCEFSEDIV